MAIAYFYNLHIWKTLCHVKSTQLKCVVVIIGGYTYNPRSRSRFVFCCQSTPEMLRNGFDGYGLLRFDEPACTYMANGKLKCRNVIAQESLKGLERNPEKDIIPIPPQDQEGNDADSMNNGDNGDDIDIEDDVNNNGDNGDGDIDIEDDASDNPVESFASAASTTKKSKKSNKKASPTKSPASDAKISKKQKGKVAKQNDTNLESFLNAVKIHSLEPPAQVHESLIKVFGTWDIFTNKVSVPKMTDGKIIFYHVAKDAEGKYDYTNPNEKVITPKQAGSGKATVVPPKNESGKATAWSTVNFQKAKLQITDQNGDEKTIQISVLLEYKSS